MYRFAAAILTTAILAAPAVAEEFETVETRDEFVTAIEGRELTRLGIRLVVSPSGEIEGSAFGGSVTGDWTWNGGYFCRDLYYRGDPLDLSNCQMVEKNGDTLRFTSDRGAGDSANLYLR